MRTKTQVYKISGKVLSERISDEGNKLPLDLEDNLSSFVNTVYETQGVEVLDIQFKMILNSFGGERLPIEYWAIVIFKLLEE